MPVTVTNLWGTKAQRVSVQVHAEHSEKARRYFSKVRRFARVFLGSMALGLAAPAVFLTFGWLPGLSATVVYLGVVMWLFPFCTPTTIEMLGIRRSVRLARASALLFIAGGFLLLFTL